MAEHLVKSMWLQAIMSRRLVTDKESRAIYNIACKTVGLPTENYRDDLSMIVEALSNIGLELRQMQDEVDGRTMVGVVNAKGDALAQLGTGYTPAELVYIKALIEAIYTAPRSSYSVSSLEALAIESDNSLTKKAREEVLANLVRHDWLRKSKSGRYALGVRAVMELQTYLKHEYEDNALQCFICNDIITMGNVCATDTPEQSCVVQVHLHCEARLKARASQLHLAGKCPECKQDWQPWPFGLPAAEELAKRKPAFGASDGGVVDDDNFDDADDPTQAAAASSTRPRRGNAAADTSTSSRKPSARSRGKKRARDDDDDEEEEEEEGGEEDEEEEVAPARGGRRVASGSRSTTTASTKRRSPRKSGNSSKGGGYVDDEVEDSE
ncbi:unnamed protein product [Tilletia controversa]|uniref:Non-structural maintenance of chromosomes element 1 homolog n=1 Tax=Tilletia controversa TaxID=13291 RepID=A0A8X7SW20_9BASI|nr:hypothetical protein CF328_g7187 [Tilletia controversa]KAE8246046.1 hypothetical protein A4X06_0g5229 [Tilletia controversa]CAD6926091.1 unnamed protein product [Tilletia controversa]CAD6934806.1 unnamed protein product [Tilletia controversa]CAD6939884.1 unnamed protein product [Tilletia controversa]